MNLEEMFHGMTMRIETDVDMSRCCSMATGGTASCVIYPASTAELEEAVWRIRKAGVNVIPAGGLTNTLVSDLRIEDIILSTRLLKGIVIKGDLFTACAGEKLDDVINKSIEHHLGGLEEFGGIPGSVGGAVFGNAGSHGKDISTYFFYADYLTKEGSIRRMPSYSDAFSYRTSPFSKGEIIITAAFRLNPIGSTAQERQKKEMYKAERIEKGQFRYPSAGCIFKNPPLLSAGRLIDECGLKGFSRKGAMISPYHANFIVNAGGATSQAVYELALIARNAVAKKFNIDLEWEIKFIGDFPDL